MQYPPPVPPEPPADALDRVVCRIPVGRERDLRTGRNDDNFDGHGLRSLQLINFRFELFDRFNQEGGQALISDRFMSLRVLAHDFG